MDANQRRHLDLDDADRRTVDLGCALKVAACAVVCALLTIIGVSAIHPAMPVVGALPLSASAPAPVRAGGV
jgi:hypothetical protein